MSQRITVIGGGPGGWAAAEAAAELGATVSIVECHQLGGTCLHEGCIPTKTLRQSAEVLEHVRAAASYGVQAGGDAGIDMPAAIARKNKVISTLCGGLGKSAAKLGIAVHTGMARIVSAHEVQVTQADGSVTSLASDAVIIATGSEERELPHLAFDHKLVLSSADMLAMEHVPQRLVILGGGVIGCEMAFIYRSFGSEVVVVEGQERILPLPGVDADISVLLQREMKKRKIEVRCQSTLVDPVVADSRIAARLVPFPTAEGEEGQTVEADALLVTVGRVPRTAGLGLEACGVELDGRGWIVVDEHLQTSVPGIYAVGDVLGPAHVMLAHVAECEGRVAARNILGHRDPMRYDVIPSAMFTAPECASVGLSEAQAREQGHNVRTATFQVRELGKAQAMGELAGICKLVAEVGSDRLLGVHLAGAHATDLIAEGTLALRAGLGVADIKATIHAHPTLAEAMHKAASIVDAMRD